MLSRQSLAVAAAGIFLAPAVPAQEVGSVPDISAEDVSQGEVVSFVNAMIAVEGVRREYLPQVQAAETQQDRETLIEQADSAALAAVEGVAGITPAEYLAIGRAARESEDLTTRINTRIADMRKTQQDSGTLRQPDGDETATQD